MTPFVIAVKITLTAALMWLILSQLDLDETMRNIGAFTVAGIGMAFVALAVQQLIAAIRLSLVMGMLREKLGLWATIRVSLIGFFFGQTFLSFLGGDAARLWELTKQNIGLRSATNGVLLDRLSGLIANHLLILGMLPWTLEVVNEPVSRLGVIMVAVAGAVGIFILFALAWMRGRLGLQKWLTATVGERRWVAHLFDLVSVLKASFTAPKLAAAALALGIVVNLFNAGIVYLLFADLGANVSLLHCVALVPLVMELAMIPVSIAGWGVREGLMVVAFCMPGAAAGAAFSVSVMFGLIGVAFGLIGCAVWLLRKPGERRLTAGLEE